MLGGLYLGLYAATALSLPASVAPPITLITASTTTPGSGGGTTAALDTTGTHLLILSIAYYAGSGGTPAVSDSKGNTWTALTNRIAGGNTGHRFFYVANPTVGSGHTFTVTGTNILPVVSVWVFAYADTVAPFEVENGIAWTGGGSSKATGPITPTTDGSLIVSGWAGMNLAHTPTVDSGLTLTTNQSPVGGTCLAGGAAYLVQPTAATINPTWSWGGTDNVAEAVAAFKVPAAPAAAEYAHVFLRGV